MRKGQVPGLGSSQGTPALLCDLKGVLDRCGPCLPLPAWSEGRDQPGSQELACGSWAGPLLPGSCPAVCAGPT